MKSGLKWSVRPNNVFRGKNFLGHPWDTVLGISGRGTLKIDENAPWWQKLLNKKSCARRVVWKNGKASSNWLILTQVTPWIPYLWGIPKANNGSARTLRPDWPKPTPWLILELKNKLSSFLIGQKIPTQSGDMSTWQNRKPKIWSILLVNCLSLCCSEFVKSR